MALFEASAETPDELQKKGIALFTGDNVDVDMPAAISIWENLVKDHNHIESQVLLGMAYFHGEGCEQNIEKAIETLRGAGKSGERGVQAAFFLGMAYIEGEKMEKDVGRGHRWLRQAAQFKHADANYQLGASMIASGSPDQLSRGCDYIGIAAELGHEKAKQFLSSANKNMPHKMREKLTAECNKTRQGPIGDTDAQQQTEEGGKEVDDWLIGLPSPSNPGKSSKGKKNKKNKKQTKT